MAYQTIQRDGSNQADIVISGTYDGVAPTAIQARWNGGAWTTIDNAPAGGTWGGTLSNQSAGQGTLEVRPTDDLLAVYAVDYVGIGDVFVIAGQSNASGAGDNNQSYSHATLKATLFGNNYQWKNLVDPTDSSAGQVDAVSNDGANPGGSYWPLIATSFLADQGVPIAFVPCALWGSPIVDWLPGADHQDRSTLYGSMVYRALQVGGIKAVLWHQGENDAAIGTSEADYNTRLDTIANAIAADLGCVIMPCKIHNITADETAVNAAIATAWGDNANVAAGPDLSDLTTSPVNNHFTTNAHLATVAGRWWPAMQAEWY